MTNAPTDAPNMFPVLAYADAPAAIEWLKTALGFQVHMVVPGDDGAIVHAELRLGAGMVMLSSVRQDDLFGARSPRQLGAATGGTYIHVDDIDAHYQRAKAAGAEMIRELAETSYGSREYSARDPEGHLWHFGNYLPGRDA